MWKNNYTRFKLDMAYSRINRTYMCERYMDKPSVKFHVWSRCGWYQIIWPKFEVFHVGITVVCFMWVGMFCWNVFRQINLATEI